MEQDNYVWELQVGEIQLGTLTAYGWYDFPWIGCKFEPKPEFDKYKHLFDDCLHFLEGGDIETLDNRVEEINRLIQLIPQNDRTQPVREYCLYIEGSDTRLRAIFAAN